MPRMFQVKVLGLKKIFDMPRTWGETDYRHLLAQLEVDDASSMPEADVLDMLFMALQDLEPEQAADAVLAYKLEKSITPGARQNIVQDLLDGQQPWEEAADIRLHARLFAAALLLHRAMPGRFPKPDLMLLTLQLKALKPEAKALLARPPQAAFVTRLLADGMDENSILERLFSEQLVSGSFPEAGAIIWMAEFDPAQQPDPTSAVLNIYSSESWLEAMVGVDEFESNAAEDLPQSGDEA